MWILVQAGNELVNTDVCVAIGSWETGVIEADLGGEDTRFLGSFSSVGKAYGVLREIGAAMRQGNRCFVMPDRDY